MGNGSGEGRKGVVDAAKKERLRFTDSTQVEPKRDSLMTSSTAEHEHRQSDNEDIDSDHAVVFHKGEFKFGCVYWRHGFSLPENGRMLFRGETLSFKGIIGTKLSFDLLDVDVDKTSRMGGLVHDAFVVSAKSAAATEEGKFLFTVLKDRKKVLEKIQTAMANAKLGKEEEEFDVISGRGRAHDAKKSKFRMLPDVTLQKMNIIAQRKLKGVSLQDYYEVAWSEGNGCDKKPMYGSFLEKQGKDNVTLTKWETSNFKGEWCGEEYTHERIVTFSFMKQTIGQTLVEVKHTQRCRRVGNDQCIVQIKMEMKGFPYADCFMVEVRHVVSRVGDNDLSIQIGLFVNFVKKTMFESKIKSNTGAETTRAQLALLGMVAEGCIPYAKEVEGYVEGSEDEEDNLETAEATVVSIVPHRGPLELPEPIFKALRFIMMTFFTIFCSFLSPYIQPELFDPFPPSTVEEAVQNARARMKLLEDISLKSVSERRRKDVTREMVLIEKSLSRIEKMSTKANVT